MAISCVNSLNFRGRISGKIRLPQPNIGFTTPVCGKITPPADCFLRADKVMDLPFYNKAVQSQMIIDIYKEAVEPQKNFNAVLKKYLAKFVSNDNNPYLPIKAIKGTPKKPENILEKVQSILCHKPELESKLVTKEGIIDEINDIVRGRIILRSADKNDTNEILKALGCAHKNGEFRIYEAEVYTPVVENMSDHFIKRMEKLLGKKMTVEDLYEIISDKEYFSYVNENDIYSFARTCGIEKPVFRSLETGYPAIHLGMITPEGYKAELQIMGCNVEALKEIEDVYYKAKCGKHIPNELADRFAPLMPETSNTQVQNLTVSYTRDAYLFERLKADKRFNGRVDTEFLVAPQELLDLGLGFNQTAPLIRKARKYSR